MEVVKEVHAGKRGMISVDGKSNNPYKVAFADGTTSGYLKPHKLKSSGLDETALLSRAMAASAHKVR